MKLQIPLGFKLLEIFGIMQLHNSTKYITYNLGCLRDFRAGNSLSNVLAHRATQLKIVREVLAQ